MAKIGIMGGTFNPIHNGHIEIAKNAYTQYGLDEVWFMPNHIPAYKNQQAIVSGIHRLRMVELAIRKIAYFKVSDYEWKRNGNTYTWETLVGLHELYPESQFFFIMGADSLMNFENWVYPERIVKYAAILVAIRQTSSYEELCHHMQELEQRYSNSVFHKIECPQIPCSSSEIRKKLADHLSDNMDYLEQFMAGDVLQYIYDNQLYV